MNIIMETEGKVNVEMKNVAALVLALVMIVSVGSVCFADGVFFDEYTVSLPGESYEIPATVCLPMGEGPFPAVVMLHSTASKRDEVKDAYMLTAGLLATVYHIATIRIDFPGCGDSKADVTQYNFTSAVADAAAAAAYMQEIEVVNPDAIGIMGWSQGGTDALLACARHPEIFRSIVTWAGAPDLREMVNESNYKEVQKKGYTDIKVNANVKIRVGQQWCEEVKNTDVLGEFSSFAGPVLAIAGTQDRLVDPAWAEKIAASSGNENSAPYYIEGMDHSFNVFQEGNLHSLLHAVTVTGTFFTYTLQ